MSSRSTWAMTVSHTSGKSKARATSCTSGRMRMSPSPLAGTSPRKLAARRFLLRTKGTTMRCLRRRRGAGRSRTTILLRTARQTRSAASSARKRSRDQRPKLLNLALARRTTAAAAPEARRSRRVAAVCCRRSTANTTFQRSTRSTWSMISPRSTRRGIGSTSGTTAKTMMHLVGTLHPRSGARRSLRSTRSTTTLISRQARVIGRSSPLAPRTASWTAASASPRPPQQPGPAPRRMAQRRKRTCRALTRRLRRPTFSPLPTK
mmetsp:Transcript_124327/g.310828  ORF Transcript_124327/g.310828 Transcript_124327/m.310828 type:complete len:263 (-) Transcript_124327:3807-4595(-)